MDLGAAGEEAGRALLDVVSLPLVVTNGDGTIVDGNEAACRLTGATREALRGASMSALFDAGEAARVAALATEARRGATTSAVLRLTPSGAGAPEGEASGGERAAPSVGVRPLPGTALLAWELRDDANRDRLLNEADAALGRVRELYALQAVFLAAVGHDLKTPLGGILHSADLLVARAGDLSGREREDAARHIRAAAGEMARVLRDLGDLGRLANRTFEPDTVTFDVAAFVASLLDGRDFEGRAVTTELEPATATVDRGLLGRVVDNLLVNVVRHTPAETKVWVRTAPVAGGAAVVVEDDGPGLPPWQLHDMLDPSVDRQGGGSGLMIVARFVEALGGEVSVAQRPGGGTSFRVEVRSPAGE